MPETPAFLFTYGTLMRNFSNPFAKKLRLAASFENEGYFNGRLYRITWYPGAVFEKNADSKVHGEIYRLQSTEILRELDVYEDVLENEEASLYVRRIIPVTAADGSILQCWAYLYNQQIDQSLLIQSGRFKR